MADGVLRVAVVGGGPRGLAAAEALVDRAPAGARVEVTVFEPHAHPGAGPHHDPGQTELNRLNIPLRAIDLPVRAGVGGFADWAAEALPECGPDGFPPRAALGAYLGARWRELSEGAAVGRVAAEVTGAERSSAGWVLEAGEARHGPFDAVVLCLGHQEVEPDPQLRRWRAHAEDCGAVVRHVYPSDALIAAAANWQGRTVAIRGLALSMIDAMRGLTEGLGGRFERGAEGLRYRPSGREPARLLPFSLDGIPPAPKPATAALDARYDVEEAEAARFERAVAAALRREPGAALEGVCAALAPVAGAVLGRFGVADAEAAVERWLAVERDDPEGHAGRDLPPAEILAEMLAMAQGRRTPSAGYAVGQVWRKLQSPLRRAFNPAAVAPETAAAVIGFDEGLKRYSYGPPVSAAEEMLALIAAGLLDLRAVDDPDVELVEGGWRLSAEEGEATATVMLDAVLAPPDLARVAAPLVAGLRDAGLLVPVAEKLGARVAPDGAVIDAGGAPVPGLALLGRLALGSVIATDSVHDCFGAAVERWADGVWERARTNPLVTKAS
jgi:uncharacterized NAD(P)/FAD-binding protein YdhS